MFAYQTAAFRRGKGIDSLVTFGSPVDTTAPLPIPLSPEAASRLASDARRQRPAPQARRARLVQPHRLQAAHAGEVGAGPRQVPAHPARPRRAAAARAAAPLPRVRGLDGVVRPGGRPVPRAVRPAQPDARRRLRHRRPAGDPRRHRPAGADRRRLDGHDRPPGLGARDPPRRAERGGLRADAARRALRARRRLDRDDAHLAGGRRVGTLARRAPAQLPDAIVPAEQVETSALRPSGAGGPGVLAQASELGVGASRLVLSTRASRGAVGPLGGERGAGAAAAAAAHRAARPVHPDLPRPAARRAGAPQRRRDLLPVRRPRAPPARGQEPRRQRREGPDRHRRAARRHRSAC